MGVDNARRLAPAVHKCGFGQVGQQIRHHIGGTQAQGVQQVGRLAQIPQQLGVGSIDGTRGLLAVEHKAQGQGLGVDGGPALHHRERIGGYGADAKGRLFEGDDVSQCLVTEHKRGKHAGTPHVPNKVSAKARGWMTGSQSFWRGARSKYPLPWPATLPAQMPPRHRGFWSKSRRNSLHQRATNHPGTRATPNGVGAPHSVVAVRYDRNFHVTYQPHLFHKQLSLK